MVDWQRAREEYDETSIDWSRLRAFAQRIARELSDLDPNSAAWVIERRYWKRVDKNRHYFETMRNEIRYLLKRDGSLIAEVTSWSEMLNPGYWETSKGVSARDFSEVDVILFDFERNYYLARDRSVETDRDRSEKLLVHAKGVGLSKRLKQLRPFV